MLRVRRGPTVATAPTFFLRQLPVSLHSVRLLIALNLPGGEDMQMKRFTSILVVTALVVGVVGSSLAADAKRQAKPPTAVKAGGKRTAVKKPAHARASGKKTAIKTRGAGAAAKKLAAQAAAGRLAAAQLAARKQAADKLVATALAADIAAADKRRAAAAAAYRLAKDKLAAGHLAEDKLAADSLDADKAAVPEHYVTSYVGQMNADGTHTFTEVPPAYVTEARNKLAADKLAADRLPADKLAEEDYNSPRNLDI